GWPTRVRDRVAPAVGAGARPRRDMTSPVRPLSGSDGVERALGRGGGIRPVPGNEVSLLFDGPAVFDAMIELIASATRWVHFDFYIIRDDETGERFAAALIERARHGVSVRVSTDWLGSF